MSTLTLEERVAELEAEVKQLKEQQDKPSEPRGWQRLVGVFKDNPEFEEAVCYGQEWRRREEPQEGEDEA